MMFYSIVFCCLVCAYAAPPTEVLPLEKQQPTVIPIVAQSEELEPNGTYKYSYETGNGIKREETSYDKVVPKAQGRSASSNEGGESGESDEIHVQQGSYSYTAPDGTVISVRYIADENGFQPIGDHIPRVPSITQPASGSSEKTGRALKVKDNSEAASAPAIVSRSGVAATPEVSPEKSESTTKLASSEASVTESKPASSQTGTTLTTSSSESDSSTTPAISEITKSSDATTASEASESSTTVAPSTPEPSELSSTTSSAEPSTTEAGTSVSA